MLHSNKTKHFTFFPPAFRLSSAYSLARRHPTCKSQQKQLTTDQPRPQGLLAFQYGGGSGEDPGTQQNHVTKISNEDGNVFKMAAKAK